jgi:hypothetical protein
MLLQSKYVFRVFREVFERSEPDSLRHFDGGDVDFFRANYGTLRHLP